MIFELSLIEIIFWWAVFLILYPYLGYPLILMVLGLFKSKKIKKSEIILPVTLLIPVYNEEKVIRTKIENSLSLDYPKDKLEIIVASESNDKTNVIVKEYESKGVKLLEYPGRQGKQSTIFRTIPQCSGEVIVLTDANGIFAQDAIKELVQSFNDPGIGCVSGELKYRPTEDSQTQQSEGIYWKYEIWVKGLESRIHSVLGANGSIYAIRKELYSPLSECRGDDFELPVRIAQQGYGVIFEPEAVSFENFSAGNEEEFHRRVRIVGWVWKSVLILLKESIRKRQFLLVFQIMSHKILRWLVGIFLIAIFLSNIFLLNQPLYLWLFVVQVIFYFLAIWGYFKEKNSKELNRLISVIYYFCAVNLGAVIGIFKSILGKQKSTWQKVR